MATVLPDNMKTILHTNSSLAHELHMTEIATNIAHVNNLMRSTSARIFNEPGIIEAMAVRKVLPLPT